MSIIIIFNGEKLKPFSLVSLKSGTNTTSFLSPLKKKSYNGDTNQSCKAREKKEGRKKDWKEETKLSSFTSDMIVCAEPTLQKCTDQ